MRGKTGGAGVQREDAENAKRRSARRAAALLPLSPRLRAFALKGVLSAVPYTALDPVASRRKDRALARAMATPSPTSAPFFAVAAALALALSAARSRVAMETALIDTLFLAGLTVLVWTTGRARYGERGAGAAALALVLFAPVLGAVGGGGLPAALLLAGGLILLTRALLDPTIQLIVAAGACLGLAVATLDVDGAARSTALAWLGAGGAALVGWRTFTAERCEPRRRVLHGAAISVAPRGPRRRRDAGGRRCAAAVRGRRVRPPVAGRRDDTGADERRRPVAPAERGVAALAGRHLARPPARVATPTAPR